MRILVLFYLAAIWMLSAVETETISSGWYWLTLGLAVLPVIVLFFKKEVE